MKRLRTRGAWIGGILAALLLVLNVVSAFLATRPALQAKIFGPNNRESLTPKDVGLSFDTVDYGEGLSGWWIPAKRAKASVVLVHGFGLSSDPIRHAPEPLLAFAKDLRSRGFNSLLVNLGYATGVHTYTGGREEAADIGRAVAWLSDREAEPVVVWGFSAGGHDALIAAANDPRIAGVASDSAFSNTGEIVQQQAALTVHLPRLALSLSPWFFTVFGGKDVDVAEAWKDVPPKPALHIHGTGDTAISPENGRRIAAATGGEVWMVDGAEHTESYNVERSAYMDRAVAFLDAVVVSAS